MLGVYGVLLLGVRIQIGIKGRLSVIVVVSVGPLESCRLSWN